MMGRIVRMLFIVGVDLRYSGLEALYRCMKGDFGCAFQVQTIALRLCIVTVIRPLFAAHCYLTCKNQTKLNLAFFM